MLTYLRIGAWAAVALLAAYAAIEFYEIRALNAQTQQYRQSAEISQKAIQSMQEQQARSEAAQETVAAEGERADRQAKEILKEINHAPDIDDGPVPPVLQRTIDRLYGKANRESSSGLSTDTTVTFDTAPAAGISGPER